MASAKRSGGFLSLLGGVVSLPRAFVGKGRGAGGGAAAGESEAAAAEIGRVPSYGTADVGGGGGGAGRTFGGFGGGSCLESWSEGGTV